MCDTSSVSGAFSARLLKRPLDLVVAALLSVLLAPFLLALAILVKLTSRGPILFKQERAGKGGKPFTIYKFRTMHGDRTPDPKELVPLDHPEITPIGRFLRRFKLDELPQLANVLLGHMSLVGPRPTLPDQARAYDAFRRQRLLVRPGITGLAQIHGNTAIPWDERILFDIAYVRRCNFMLDVRIVLRSLAVILRGDTKRPAAFRETRYAAYVTPPKGYGTEPGDRRGM